MTYSYMADETAPNFISGEGWSLKTVYMTSERIFDEKYHTLQFNQFQGLLSNEATYYQNALNQDIMETFIDIIMGEDIDAFDRLAEDWEAGGGDKIKKEVNQLVPWSKPGLGCLNGRCKKSCAKNIFREVLI